MGYFGSLAGLGRLVTLLACCRGLFPTPLIVLITCTTTERLVTRRISRTNEGEDDKEEEEEGGDLAQLGGVDLNTGCAGLHLQIQLGLRDITFLVLVWREMFSFQEITSLYV